MDALPSFCIDAAAFAQQLAAVVADEKKLSDVRLHVHCPVLSVCLSGELTSECMQNIMDLIPPPLPISTGADSSSVDVSSMSLTTPLAPPPGLMMRALSPPMSLLPELSNPMVPPLSLLGEDDSAAAQAVTAVMSAALATDTLPPASVAVAPPIVMPSSVAPPTSVPATNSNAIAAAAARMAEERRKAMMNNGPAGLLKKVRRLLQPSLMRILISD